MQLQIDDKLKVATSCLTILTDPLIRWITNPFLIAVKLLIVEVKPDLYYTWSWSRHHLSLGGILFSLHIQV